MYGQTDLETKLAALKAYSIERDAATGALFVPTEVAASKYFAALKAAASSLRDVVKYMYNDISRRTTEYEHKFPLNLPINYPEGFSDLRNCCYDFTPILMISVEDFFAAFVYETQGGGEAGGTTTRVIASNSYLDEWTAALTSAAVSTPASIAAVAEWCKNSEGNGDLIDLFEDRGSTVKQLSREEIARIIYIDRGLLDLVQTYGINIYIPTYIEGG